MSNYLIPGEVRCWSCGKWMSNNELENADGCCPFCDEEICTNEPPYTSDSEQGGPMNDITALAQREMEQREKFEAWTEESCALPWGYLKKRRTYDGFYSEHTYTSLWAAWKAASMALVEALEKAQQKNTELNQRNTALTAKIEPMDRRIAELEEIATDYGMKFQRAQDDLKKMALMESRTVTVKLAEDKPAESESEVDDAEAWFDEGWNARGEADRDALAAAGIQVIEGEGHA